MQLVGSLCVGALAVALSCGGAGAGVAAAAGEEPAAGQPVTAPEQAAASGTRVELPEQRTENATVFAEPDGTFTAEVSNVPVRVRRGTGWVSVDPTLMRRPDGSIAPRASAVDVVFSGGGSAPLARVRKDESVLSVGSPFTLPTPSLEGNRARYAEVLPGVDLVVTAEADTFSEVLVVKDAKAAANSRLRSLNFPLRSTGLEVRRTGEGGLEAADRFGRVVLASPQPLMWDSTANVSTEAASTVPRAVTKSLTGSTTASESAVLSAAVIGAATDLGTGATTAEAGVAGPVEGDRVAAMPVSVSSSALQVKPDTALLSGSGVTYPVYIDPSLGPTKSGWSMVNSAYPSQEYWKWSGDEGVGYNNTTGTTMRKRLFFKFPTSKVNGATIISAKFYVTETFAYSCTPSTIEIWRTGEVTSSTNWSNQPSWKAEVDSASVAYGRSGCDPDGRRLSFYATKAVSVNAANKTTYTTLGMRASNETSNTGWKRFNNTATLSISYNHPPTKPTGLAMLSPSKPCVAGDGRSVFAKTNLPDLKATPQDADSSEKVTAAFEVWTLDGATRKAAVNKTGLSPGTAAQVAIPTLAEGDYKWRVRTKDPVTVSLWAGWCEFRVDATAPPEPTVTLAEGNDYTQGSV